MVHSVNDARDKLKRKTFVEPQAADWRRSEVCYMQEFVKQSSMFSSTRTEKKKSKDRCLALKILVFEVVM